MSDGAERREARRFNMSLPMRIVACDARQHELKTNTRDVSYRGLYFMTDIALQKGSKIDFVITLPQQAVSNGDVNIRCRGQIVRVEPTENGHTGIAAKIEHYEFVPSNIAAA